MSIFGMTRGSAVCFTFTSNVAANDTVVIGNLTYTFVAAPSAAFEVDVGSDLATSILNLQAAINLSGTAGTEYGASHVAKHDSFYASAVTGTTITLVGRLPGAHVNGVYLAATSPGANTIAVTGTPSPSIFSGVTSATLGVGAVEDSLLRMETDGMQPNATIIAAIHELSVAAD